MLLKIYLLVKLLKNFYNLRGRRNWDFDLLLESGYTVVETLTEVTIQIFGERQAQFI